MAKKSTSAKVKKGAKSTATAKSTPEEKHQKFLSDIERVLRKHGIRDSFSSLTLTPLEARCNPPCPRGQHCVRRVDRNTHEVFYLCVDD